MGLFDVTIPEGSETPLTPTERESIDNAFARGQRPLHIVFRADIRYHKTTRKRNVCALSPHFIGLFSQKEPGSPFTCYEMFHISEVEMIAHKQGEFVLVQTKESKLTIVGEQITRFAQLLYRNYYITFSMNSPEDIVELRADHLELFPDITIHASPSQRFQFAYYAMCTANGLPYNQDVVRYIHNLILSRNSIVDVSQLPLDLFANSKGDGDGKKSDLVPIFHSFKLMRFVSGLCAVNLMRPDILKAFGRVLSHNDALKIVHFANCGIESGMEELADAVAKNENLSVVYWDLSYNKIQDVKCFARILENATSAVSLINLNYVTSDEEATAAILRACAHNENLWSLKYLYVAGLPMSEESALSGFEEYLRARRKCENPLELLDLSSQEKGVDKILKTFNRYPQPLRELYLRDSVFDIEATNQLLILIRESTTLHTLDVSGSNFSAEDVAGVIHAIIQNDNLSGFTLKLSSLNLHDKHLLPLFRAFLSSKASLSKWKSLAFDSNDMERDDLKNLLPLFLRMRNLEELSFNYNFDASMEGVDEQVARILEINKIKKISIRGCEGHRLKDQLILLLRRIGKRPTIIESLDISGNHIGDVTMAYLVQIMHKSSCVLQSLNIDDNDFRNTNTIKDFIEAMEQNESLTSFTFPLTDAKAIIENADEDEREIVIRTLSELQINAAQRINVNRTKQKKPNDLPFPAREDIQELISEISRGARHRLKSAEFKRHTCVCQEFGLPLPFQRLGDVVTDGGELDDSIDIGEMAIYETPSMGEYIIEKNTMYPEFMYTTMQPDLRKFVSPQEAPQFIPPPETRKHRRSSRRSHKMKVKENDSDDETQNERASKKTQVETDSETSKEDSVERKGKQKKGTIETKASKKHMNKYEERKFSSEDDESSENMGKKGQRNTKEYSSDSEENQKPSKSSKKHHSDSYEATEASKKTRKSKKLESDSDESSDSEEMQKPSKNSKKHHNDSFKATESSKKTKKSKKLESDSDESSEEMQKPSKNSKKHHNDSFKATESSKKTRKSKGLESDSTESFGVKDKPRRTEKSKLKQKESTSSDSDDDRKNRPSRKVKKFSSSSSDHQSQSDEATRQKRGFRYHDEQYSSSDEELAAKRKKFEGKKVSRKFVLDSESSEDSRRPKHEVPPVKPSKPKKKKHRKFSSDSDDEVVRLGTRLMNNDDIDQLMDTGVTYETRSRNLRDSGEFTGKPAPPLKLKPSLRATNPERLKPALEPSQPPPVLRASAAPPLKKPVPKKVEELEVEPLDVPKLKAKPQPEEPEAEAPKPKPEAAPATKKSGKAVRPPPRRFLDDLNASDSDQPKEDSKNIFESSSSSDGNFPVMKNLPVRKPPPQASQFKFSSSSDDAFAPPPEEPVRRKQRPLAPSIGDALKKRQQEQRDAPVIPRPAQNAFRPPPRRS